MKIFIMHIFSSFFYLSNHFNFFLLSHFNSLSSQSNLLNFHPLSTLFHLFSLFFISYIFIYFQSISYLFIKHQLNFDAHPFFYCHKSHYRKNKSKQVLLCLVLVAISSFNFVHIWINVCKPMFGLNLSLQTKYMFVSLTIVLQHEVSYNFNAKVLRNLFLKLMFEFSIFRNDNPNMYRVCKNISFFSFSKLNFQVKFFSQTYFYMSILT